MRKPSSLGDRKPSGFTLAELLVVIVILGLLATILVPTINAILQRTYQLDTKQRIHGLAEGADKFKIDTGFYPGQADYLQHRPSGTYKYTGSQVLAAILFDMRDDGVADPYHALDDDDPRFRFDENGENPVADPTGDPIDADGNPMRPQGLYAKYEPGMLSGPRRGDATVVDRDNALRFLTIMDCFPRPHPIAYYMSNPVLGTPQYHLEQNLAYTLPAGGSVDVQRVLFTDRITDTRFPPDYLDPGASAPDKPAVRDGMFLLISSGVDGEWFNDDDVGNWKTGG